MRVLSLIRVAVFAAATLSSAVGQVSPTPAKPQYPLALNTRWTYQLREELGANARVFEQDAALVKGNVLEATVVAEVAGFDTVGGMKYARVESRKNGRLWMTDWCAITPQGLMLGKANEDGEEHVMVPPQKMLSPTLNPGESWAWKNADPQVTIATSVVGREATEVPAGRFEATKISHEMTVTLPTESLHVSESRWFSPNVGFVREETEEHVGDVFISHDSMTLVSFEPGQSGQALPGRAVAPATPPGEAVRYEARWDVQTSGVTDQLDSVYFINPTTGWAAGRNNTILKTSDGGKSWKRVLEREEGGNGFHSITFANENEGWAQGDSILLHSSDGGETWRPASPLPDRKNLGDGTSVGSMRLQTGQFGTSDGVYKSTDGGTTWTKSATLPRNDFTGIFASDPQHIWVIGDYGRYALTTDAGAGWKEPTLPVKANLRKIYFFSAEKGWILPSDHNGGPLATMDGGLTWASQYAGAGQNRPLRDIHFVTARDGFLLVGSNRPDVVYRTSDGGAKWQTIGQLPEGRTAMSFPTLDNGWVVGPNGYIVHYHLVPVPVPGK